MLNGRMSNPGTPENPLRVAIIGAGPSGFYAADQIIKDPETHAQVDLFDRLPTPYGLVRGGVAPDHPKIKSVTRVYEKTAAKEGFRFFGNVEIGRDLNVEDFEKHYHAVIYTFGAEADRELGIPGEDLPGIVAEFGPGPQRRLGVLVDHLVAGSKEARIAEEVRRSPAGAHTLVVGHPYVDIWQAVKPERLGLERWPVIPRNIEWKHGICDALGWPHGSQADIARAWQKIRSRVRDWTDLEPALIGRVEELIDFVTAPGQA